MQETTPRLTEREQTLRDALEACLLTNEQDVHRTTVILRQLHSDLHAVSGAITSVSLIAEMVVATGRQSDQADLTPNLLESLARVRRIVERMKDSIRDNQSPEVPAFDIVPVAKQCVDDFQRRFPNVQWRWSSAVDQVNARMRGGAESLRRVLEPLLTNALEGDGPRNATQVDASLSLRPGTQELHLDLTDNGPGFPAAFLQPSVAPFITTKRDHLGLGLFTAQRLARSNGGDVRIENRKGGGALVRVALPFVS